MGRPLRVLAVEDSQSDALLIMRELQRAGYDPVYERVETREEMAAALRNREWDVVLADYTLPRFSGLDALELVQRLGMDIPFVVVSGSIGEETAVETMKAGAHDYIMKDKLSRLASAVEREIKDAGVRRARRQAEEKVARLNRLYTVLYGINQMIVRATDLQKLFDEACRIAVENGRFRLAWIGLVDRESGTVSPVSYCGAEGGYLENIRITVKDVPEGRGPTGRAIRDNKPCIYNDIEHDPDMAPWREAALKRGYRSSAAFPLTVDGNAEGAFMVYAQEPSFFDDDETTLLTELADDISCAMHHLEQEKMRQDVEGALHESERKFRVLVEDSQVGVYIIQEGAITYVNPRLACMFGYTVEEMTGGLNVLDLVSPAFRQEAAEKMAKVLSDEDKSQFYAFTAARKDGSVIDVELFGSKTMYGKNPAIIGTLLDVTERNRAEEAIKAEAAVSNALLKAAGITTAYLDFEEAAGKTLELLRDMAGFMEAALAVIMLDDDGGLRPLKAAGWTEDDLAHFYSFSARLEDVPALAEVVRSRNTMSIRKSELSGFLPEQCISAFSLKEMIISPITSRDKVVGFLCGNFSRLPKDPRVTEIYAGVAGQLGIACENARLYEETQRKGLDLARKVEALRVLSEIDRMILSTLNRDEMLSGAVFQARRILPADAGGVYLLDREAGVLRYTRGWGMEGEKGIEVKPDRCRGFAALNTKKTTMRMDFREEGRACEVCGRFMELDIVSDMFVPIVSKDAGVGVLYLGSKRVAGFSLEDAHNAENLVNQIGVALENTKLVADLEEMLVSTVEALASAIDAKSPWTKGHSERVTSYAVMIARRMGLPEAEVEKLKLAGLLHDIGKIGTLEAILDKPGKLTDEEFALIKRHPARGCDILSSIKQFKDILPAIRHHHESLDGKGYPAGLKGDEIPLSARILCVADSFDSMTADRPYRPSPGLGYAVEEFRRCSGSQFDPEVVEAFLEIITEEKKAA